MINTMFNNVGLTFLKMQSLSQLKVCVSQAERVKFCSANPRTSQYKFVVRQASWLKYQATWPQMRRNSLKLLPSQRVKARRNGTKLSISWIWSHESWTAVTVTRICCSLSLSALESDSSEQKFSNQFSQSVTVFSSSS